MRVDEFKIIRHGSGQFFFVISVNFFQDRQHGPGKAARLHTLIVERSLQERRTDSQHGYIFFC